MKIRRHICWIFIFLIAVTCSCLSGQKDPRRLKFPDIVFQPPQPGYVKIKKGIDFYFQEDHRLPVISITVIFKTGTKYDPVGKEGLTSMTWRLMRNGGTLNSTPGQVDERLDFLGSSISISFNEEFSQVSLWTLSKNFNATWQILMDMILTPRFDQKGLEREKKIEQGSLQRRWERPMDAAYLLFRELVYGEHSPLVRRTTTRSLKAITLEDTRRYYDNYIRHSQVVMGCCGDFDTRNLRSEVEKHFAAWKVKPLPGLEDRPVKTASLPGIYFLPRNDLNQAIILMGHPGIHHSDPDNAEIGLLNFIYGSGGFSSRLMQEIRTRRGLAYHVNGFVRKGRNKGMFLTTCVTAPQVVPEVIRLIKRIMTGLCREPVTEEELDVARRNTRYKLIHIFKSPCSVLLEKIRYKIHGYPDNYFETFIPRVNNVNSRKIMQMAMRTMHPGKLVILVVGRKESIYAQLESLDMGEIKTLRVPVE